MTKKIKEKRNHATKEEKFDIFYFYIIILCVLFIYKFRI